MTLEMHGGCERCGVALVPGEPAWICAHECTFCVECAGSLRHVCPNCGGGLVRCPRPATVDA